MATRRYQIDALLGAAPLHVSEVTTRTTDGKIARSRSSEQALLNKSIAITPYRKQVLRQRAGRVVLQARISLRQSIVRLRMSRIAFSPRPYQWVEVIASRLVDLPSRSSGGSSLQTPPVGERSGYPPNDPTRRWPFRGFGDQT